MKYRYKKLLASALTFASLLCAGCSESFLDQESDTIFTEEEVFSDPGMIKSVLAGFYNEVSFDVHLGNYETNGKRFEDFGVTDEASSNEPTPSLSTFSDDVYRLYPYSFIRELNIFLQSIKGTKVLNATEIEEYEAEVRFLRAWTYLFMARGMGGMPIVGDRVFELTDNVADMRLPRSTEQGMYDYIIEELEWCARHLPDQKRTNASRANKWTALALKARAAITAASLAKYNNLVTPEITTPGREVGIPAEAAAGFYETARAAAHEIITDGPYALYDKVADRTENFYKLFIDKNDNPEVMWVRDFKGKDCVQYWASGTCPAVTAFGSTNRCVPLLNLVEAYEYLDNRNGELKIADAKGDYIFYENPAELFENKDPRMKATVICSGDQFAGKEIIYQAGQMKTQNKKWRKTTGAPGVTDVDGDVITGENGPRASAGLYDNVTGFNFRKYSEEDDAARQPSNGSEVWNIYIRFAEVKLIRAEALLELDRAEEGLADINDIRKRGGLGSLSSYTIADIEQERRVEFPLEGHRWWDLKRWRRSHEVWDGVSDSSVQWSLFPYKVKDPRSAENGKWAFEKVANNKRPLPRKFELRNYYNFLSSTWLANNPKLVKNPYQ